MVPFLTEPPQSVQREAAPFEVPAKIARAVPQQTLGAGGGSRLGCHEDAEGIGDQAYCSRVGAMVTGERNYGSRSVRR